MKATKKHIAFPEPMVEAIKDYQEENMIPTFTTAVQELVREGLKSYPALRKNRNADKEEV